MNLDNYLQRIAFTGAVRADLSTLSALLRAHVCAVPFENLDVQLGRPLTTAAEDAYEKIVGNGRGGWCYEQNGLFCWALSEIGFDVTRLAAAVMRHERGDASTGNHLCIQVNVPGDSTGYLVDVGFGGSLFDPIKLKEAEYMQPPYRLGLKKLDDGFWRFWEDNGSGAFSFDFLAEAGDESALSKKSEFLQTDPSSGFVQNLVAQLRTPSQHMSLRGRVLTTVASDRNESRTLNSADELVSVLGDEFNLHVPEIVDVWPRILSRHEQLFGRDTSSTI